MPPRQQPIRYEQQREYAMSVPEAWRILADTEHLNRTIGLPAIAFSPLAGAGDPLTRQARARAYGVMPLRWKEFPFDWVRERRYAVRREFESGPIDWLEGGVELAPAGDGVIVKAFADFTPRNVTGRFLWKLGRAPVTGLLEFCDLYLARKAAGKADPVPVPKVRAAVDRALLEQRLAELGRAPVAARLLPLLRERVLEGSDDQLTSVRAFVLADVWQAERLDVLRLLLHATRAGLFDLRWELMCPNCRVPKAKVGTMAEIPPQFHCETCGISYATDSEQRVELRFSINQAVRRATDETYCIGGPLRMPHIFAQQYLGAHEDRRVELALEEPLLLRAIGGAHMLSLVRAAPSSRVAEVKVTYAGGRWVGPHSLLDGDTLAVPEGAVVALRNQTDGAVLALFETLAWTRDATTAGLATTLPEFRALFGTEALRSGQQLALRHVALLFSGLARSTELYEQLGDTAAYDRIRRHFDLIGEIVVAAGGTVVKTIGDGTMSAFHELEGAVEAALAIQQRLAPWCTAEGIDPPLAVKLGLHHGPVITATANDRLDYLGRTANVAAWLRDQCRDQCRDQYRDQCRGGELVMLAETIERLSEAPLEGRAGVALETFTASENGAEHRLVRVTNTLP